MLNRRDLLAGTAVALLPDMAGAVGVGISASAISGAGISGHRRSVINLEVEPNSLDYRLINLAKLSDRVIGEGGASRPNDWSSYVNEYNYPTSATQGLDTRIYVPEAGTYIIRWSGSGSVSAISFSLSGASAPGYNAATPGVITTNGRMTFTQASTNTSSFITVRGTTMTNLLICRDSDEAAYDGGARVRQVFKDWISAFKPSYIRYMDASMCYVDPIVNWADRQSVDSMNYCSTKFFDARKLGDIGGNSTLLYSLPSYTGMPAQYTSGEFVHGICPNANQSTVAPGVQVAMNTSRHNNLGSATGGGGLAAAFDGTTSKVLSACATRAAATLASVGKAMWWQSPIYSAVVYPSSDQGFTSAGGNVTIQLRASNSGPPSTGNADTFGTQLATSGSIANTTSPVTLTSSDATTKYQWVWIAVTASSGTIAIAQFTPTLIYGGTLDVGGRGARPVLSAGGLQLENSGNDSSIRIRGGQGATYTFIYDEYSDCWWIYPFGLPVSQAMESFVQVSNETNVPGWFNIPFYASDDFITQFATYVAQNHTPVRPAFEFCNEYWNFAMACTQRGNMKGEYVYGGYGFNSSYGVRFREMAVLIRAAFAAQGRTDAVLIFGVAGYMVQTEGDTDAMEQRRYQNPFLPHMSGANAPILYADMICWARYYSSGSLRTTLNSLWYKCDYTQRAALKTAVDLYLAGGASRTQSYEWAKSDILNSDDYTLGSVARAVNAHASCVRLTNGQISGLPSKQMLQCQYECNHEIDPPPVEWTCTQQPLNDVPNMTTMRTFAYIACPGSTVVSTRDTIIAGATKLIVSNSNSGGISIWVKLGDSSVAATTSAPSTEITAGTWRVMDVGSATHIAYIASSLDVRYLSVATASPLLADGTTGTGGNVELVTATKTSQVRPLQAGTKVAVLNPGFDKLHIKLGTDATVTATDGDTEVAIRGGWTVLDVSSNGYLAFIIHSTAGATTTIQIAILGGTGSVSNGATGTNPYGEDTGYIAQFIDGFFLSQQYYDTVMRLLTLWYGFYTMQHCCLFSMAAFQPWMTFRYNNALDPAGNGGTVTSASTPYQNWYAHADWNNAH